MRDKILRDLRIVFFLLILGGLAASFICGWVYVFEKFGPWPIIGFIIILLALHIVMYLEEFK